MDNNFIDKVLKYEEQIFQKYISKRKNLIENMKNLQLNDLNDSQLSNLTSDLKLIIDPIKTAIESIDDYFDNYNSLFVNNDSSKSIKELNDIMSIYTFLLFFGD